MNLEPGKPLEKEDVERLISAEMAGAWQYVYGADNIQAERDRNYDYYRGIMNDLPAPPGRSRVVDTTVADYIGMALPNLVRIFTASRNIGEYVTPKPELQEATQLVTRFVNDVVFRKDNRGELMLNDWAQDAMVQKLGIAMWWWEERWETEDETYQGITPDVLPQFAQEMQARGVEIVAHTAEEGLHLITVRKKVNKSKCCIEIIPPEEFAFSRDARTIHGAVLKGHRTGAFVGDLIGAGYDAETVNALPTYFSAYQDRGNKYTNNSTDTARDSIGDAMLRKVCVTRGIVTCNYDGTGLKDWYFVAGGFENAPKLLEIEPYADQIGFAGFCPEPLAHCVIGTCPADRLAPIQKRQTVITRLMHDSLYLAVTPQREVVKDWVVSPDQLMNLNPGAPVMVKQPNAIREIAIPFVGREALAVLQYNDARAETTSGTSRTSAGLDPDTLQNQSATASANLFSAMMGRNEHIARTWAQGGMRDLFRGVFRCLKTYQDFERVELISGKPTPVDPRKWEVLGDLEVNINTGLGTGNRERDFIALTALGAAQKEAYTLLGPGNPVVDLKMLVRTEQLKAEAAGVAYPENFFREPVNPDGSLWEPQQQDPQPSQDIVYQFDTLYRIEEMKTKEKGAEAVAKITSEERTTREKNYWDTLLKAESLNIDRTRLVLDAAKVDSGQVAKDMEAGRPKQEQPAT